MQSEFDVVILGSGVAGGVAARKLRKAGLSVVLVEPGPFGGTCPLRGCEPKKVLFDALEPLVRCSNQSGQGLHGGPSLNWDELRRFKDAFVQPVSEAVEEDLLKRGIEVVKGRGRFIGPRTVEADGMELTGSFIVVGTGAGPRKLDFPGAEHLLTSTGFFDLASLPDRLAVIGGGFIAFEFANFALRAGSSVDMLIRSDRCLKAFDSDLVAMLLKHLRYLGARIHFQAPIDEVRPHGEGFLVTAAQGRVEVSADLVLHGAGRVPNTDDLGLDRAGVRASELGIDVDAFMRSVSNQHVYAAGDVGVSGPKLTPVALMEAEILCEHILGNSPRGADYRAVPSVLFTHPVLGRTGALEEELRQEGIPYQRVLTDTSDWAAFQRIGEGTAGAKLLLDPDSGEILGAHFLGERAEEVVNLFGLAIERRIPLQELRRSVWSYPSFIYDAVRHLHP